VAYVQVHTSWVCAHLMGLYTHNVTLWVCAHIMGMCTHYGYVHTLWVCAHIMGMYTSYVHCIHMAVYISTISELPLPLRMPAGTYTTYQML